MHLEMQCGTPELPTLPRNSPVATLAPTGLLVCMFLYVAVPGYRTVAVLHVYGVPIVGGSREAIHVGLAVNFGDDDARRGSYDFALVCGHHIPAEGPQHNIGASVVATREVLGPCPAIPVEHVTGLARVIINEVVNAVDSVVSGAGGLAQQPTEGHSSKVPCVRSMRTLAVSILSMRSCWLRLTHWTGGAA